MHRIDTDGATVSNLFTDGNPAAGQEGTVCDDAWLNDVQENICQAIEAAGIVLAKGQYGQLLAAIRALAANGAMLPSGGTSYFKDASGFILQFGTVALASGSGGTARVTFPLAFPTACYFGIASNYGGVPTSFAGAQAWDQTGMTVGMAVSSGVASGAGTASVWIAIGK